MRRLIAVLLVALAACRSGQTAGSPSRQPFLDLTGADVAQWDSLSRTYFIGPQPPVILLPPLPPPARMLRSKLDMVLRIDDRGRLARVSVTPPKDVEYVRKFVAELRELRFKPALTRDGKPITGYYRFTYQF